MSVAYSIEKLDAIKGVLVIFTFGIGTWIKATNLFNVCCVSKKHDDINFHLNDSSTQIHKSIVFKFSDHKANICPYPFSSEML